MNPPPIPSNQVQAADPAATATTATAAEEAALAILEATPLGQRVLASKWTKIAIGVVASVAGFGWLVPLLRGSSTWEAKDAIVAIGFAGTLMGMLTSSGVSGVTRLAFARKVAEGSKESQASKG